MIDNRSISLASFDDLDLCDQNMIKYAIEWAEKGFPKHRNTFVGCAMATINGNIFCGTHIAHRRMHASTCAERMALEKAQLSDPNIDKIYVWGKRRDRDFANPVSSCGCCRQLIAENTNHSEVKNPTFYLCNTDLSSIAITKLRCLLPLAFDREFGCYLDDCQIRG